MKRIFKIEDIKNFLESHEYIWRGSFYDKRTTRQMTEDDLSLGERFELGVTYGDLTMLRLFTISNFEFIKGDEIIKGSNWSAEWQQLLLDKYPQYAQMLIDHAQANIDKIDSNLVTETNNLISRLTRLKEHTDIEKAKFTNMKNLAEAQLVKNKAKREKYDVDYIRPYLEEDIDE